MKLVDSSTIRVGLGVGCNVRMYVRSDGSAAHVTLTTREAAELAMQLITASERADGSHGNPEAGRSDPLASIRRR